MFGIGGSPVELATAAAAAAAAAADEAAADEDDDADGAVLEDIVAELVVTVDVWPDFPLEEDEPMLRFKLCSNVSLICVLEIPEAAATWARAFNAESPYSSRLVFWKRDA